MEKSKLESAFLDLAAGKVPAVLSSAVPEGTTACLQPVTFTPSRVDGVADVCTVTVDAEQIVLHTSSGDHAHSFASIARRQESRLMSLLKRWTFQRPWPSMVADRSWCVDSLKANFVFYTDPTVTVYMPSGDVADYATCYFSRVRDIIHSGRYATFDVN